VRAADGDAMDIEEFLVAAEQAGQQPSFFLKPTVVSNEMPQGPPCLQQLIQIGFAQGTRNSGLFNLGVYCRKLDPDKWQSLLEEMKRKVSFRQACVNDF